MAKVSNETKLVLALAKEKHEKTQKSRIQTTDQGYITGYNICFGDIWAILDKIATELEGK